MNEPARVNEPRGDEQPARPGLARHLAWLLALAVTTGSVASFAIWLTASLRPHAFSARDGQGAAGLAALLLLSSLLCALIAGALTGWLAIGLRRRGARYAPRVTLIAIGAGLLLGLALPLLP